MDSQASLRQSRHALLDGFDEEGVQSVRRARALVIGAGGLGCPAATYLAASGIGTLHWVDGDVIEITNLGRQPLYSPQDIGQPKVSIGARALAQLSPETEFVAEVRFADEDFLRTAVPLADVVLDCTDQWKSRQLINRICIQFGVPLVSASAIAWAGQLLVIDPRLGDQACYACVFDPLAAPEDAACGAFGVLSPLVGAMGALQSAEALKILTRKPALKTEPENQSQLQLLTLLDMRSGRCQQVQVSRNPACPICGSGLARKQSGSN